ncbi:MAG TPA: hypothetical protein DIS94_05835 [Bacteroidetes bacterium]|nr:hypothetical protein [Bacteroidota bacterium]
MKTLFLTLLILTGANNLNAQGWYWQTPKPVGASLHTTSAAGNIFYAAGDAGTIVKSTNSGINWMHIPTTGTTNSILLIANNAEDFVYFIDDLNNFYLSSTGGESWTIKPSPFQNPKKILMKSINTHFVLTNNKLWRTTNGGVNFIDVAPVQNSEFRDFDFINTSTGFVISSDGTNSILYRTTNFGTNWNQINIPVGNFNAVDFFDMQNGYIGGEDGLMRRTTNGGLEWNIVSLSNVYDVSAIQMFNTKEAYFICKDNTLWSLSWNNAYRVNDVSGVTSLSATGSNLSFAGYTGKIWVRESGWLRTINTTTYNTFNRINFLNANTGIMAGTNGAVSKSIDGGNTWVQNVINPNVIFYGMDFINSSTGFICGERGTIYRTTNGGQTWQLRNENFIYWLNAVNMINNSTGFAVGYNGIILMTTNAGGLWLEDVISPGEQFFDIEFINNNTGYSCSNKLYKSTDGGLSWVYTNFSIPIGFHDINFLNENTGFIVGQVNSGDGGKIFKSTNGGNSWMEKFYAEEPFYSIKFQNETTGFATAGRGSIYKTINGGETWFRVFRNGLLGEQGLVNHNIMYRDVAFRTSSEIYFTGSYGNVLISDNGGSVNVNQISSALPEGYELQQNYPNPFNPETKIRYNLKTQGDVSLKVFDMMGREVKSLVNRQQTAGSYEVSFNGAGLSSGVYFYRITVTPENSNSFVYIDTKKMLLVK